MECVCYEEVYVYMCVCVGVSMYEGVRGVHVCMCAGDCVCVCVSLFGDDNVDG